MQKRKFIAYLETRLTEISETDLRVQFIIPLFNALGFERVEDFHGSDEEGKDIVCWKVDELGDFELSVAQIKRYKFTKRAADTQSFSEVVTQLSMAAEKRLPHVSGESYLPHTIYLITPYQIDTKTLKSRFEGIRSLRTARIKILDGPKLARLIAARLPKQAAKLCGSTYALDERLLPRLANDDLLSALDLETGRPVETFFTDLDLTLGRRTTTLFFGTSYQPQNRTLQITQDRWDRLKRLNELTLETFNVAIIGDDLANIDLCFIKARKQQEDIARRRAHNRRALNKLTTQGEALQESLAKKEREARERYPELVEVEKQRVETRNDLVRIERKLHECRSKPGKKRSGLEKEKVDLLNKLSELDERINSKVRLPENFSEEWRLITAKIRSLEASQAELQTQVEHPHCEITITGEALASRLSRDRKNLLRRIHRFNQKVPSPKALKNLLQDAVKVFRAADRVLGQKKILDILGLPSDLQYRDINKATRLSVPINKIFNTGLSLLVLGEAGAGKTTSLQKYAAEKLRDRDPQDLILYAPLVRLIEKWRKDEGKLSYSSVVNRFEAGISAFLRGLGLAIETEELPALLKKQSSLLLLDGIDEVVNEHRWLYSAISSLRKRYPELQIIISARHTAPGLDSLKFPAIVLLPFTEEQRDNFFKLWFKDQKSSVGKIIRHLSKNPELDRVIRTPLSATILCVLHQHSLPLPTSETRLYEERFRLLLGDLDPHRGVRRIKSQRYYMRLGAQKLAFRLHCSSSREAEPAILRAWLAESFKGIISKRESERIVKELIDPCNVLVPMTGDGKLGFGHLRFQEHLVAMELLQNRSLQITRFMTSHWWRGALVLFSQMNESIEWLLEESMVAGNVAGIAETALAMVEARPFHERAHLREMVESHVQLEYSDILSEHTDSLEHDEYPIEGEYLSLAEEDGVVL